MTNKEVRVATIDKVGEIFEACSLVLIKKDKILMQLRDNKKGIFYPGYWCVPGGRVEKGEDSIAAI